MRPMSKAFAEVCRDITLVAPVCYTAVATSVLRQVRRSRAQFVIHFDNQTQDKVSQKHAEVILSLTLLAILACMRAGPTIFTLERAGLKIMKLLPITLEQANIPLSESFDGSLYQDVQLWALYIAATWEWDSGQYRKGKAWFIPRLQFLVAEAGLSCWTDLMGICDKFLYINADRVDSGVLFPGMDWPEDLLWAGPDRYQPSSSKFLEELLFGGEG